MTQVAAFTSRRHQAAVNETQKVVTIGIASRFMTVTSSNARGSMTRFTYRGAEDRIGIY